MRPQNGAVVATSILASSKLGIVRKKLKTCCSFFNYMHAESCTQKSVQSRNKKNVKRIGAPLWKKIHFDLNVGFTIALAWFYVVLQSRAVS